MTNTFSKKPSSTEDQMKTIMKEQVSIDESGDAIISNLFVQIPVFLGLVFIFIIGRRMKPWIYYPNVKNLTNHPVYAHADTKYGWIKTLFRVKDTQLMSLVGLDSFMFLQTLKLLLNIMIIMAIAVCPILCIYFYKINTHERKYFLRISSKNVNNGYCMLMMVVMCYVVSLLIFYLVFIYYKRYIVLRQIYLTSPATMTSISRLKGVSQKLPENVTVVNSIDVCSRTVLIDKLPGEISTDAQCKDYIERLEIGEIENVILVKDTYRLQKLIEDKKSLVQDIEKEIDMIFREMERHFRENNILARVSFRGCKKELVKSALESNTQGYTVDEKINISNWYFANVEKFCEMRKKRCSLQMYLKKFKRVEEDILRERGRVITENQMDSTDNVKTKIYSLKKIKKYDDYEKENPENTRTPSDGDRLIEPNINNSLFIEADPEKKDLSFFSWNQMRNFNKNKVLFSLDLPIGKKKAFVTFTDRKATNIVIHSRIGSKVFSCNASQAPAPYDILWKNLPVNDFTQYFARIISYFIFFFIIVSYSFAAIYLIASLKIEYNTQNVFLKFISAYPYLSSLYSGFIGPFVYNLLQYLITFIFSTLLNLQGITSYSIFQAKLMRAFSLFSFFNSFLFICVGSIVYDIAISSDRKSFDIAWLLNATEQSIIKSAVFFVNTILQRTFIGTAIVLLKPAPFIFNFFVTPLIKKSRRQKLELQYVQPINFGIVIPDSLVVFSIVLGYSFISPIIIFIGLIFYILTYLVYKNDLMYATKNDYESGGIYWIFSVKIIVYSVIIFQSMLVIKAYTSNHKILSLFLIPLFLIDYLYKNGLREMFERNCEYYPLNVDEENYLDEFTSASLRQRFELLKSWEDDKIQEDQDTLLIMEVNNATVSYTDFYQDPSLASDKSKLILPENFFAVINYIKKNDSENLFKMS